MDEYIGIIKIFGGNFAPRGWAFCNGSLLPISQYDAVFALLGTTFGGDGQTTFALPDWRSRTPIGTGQGPGLSSFVEGQVGGNENVTLLTQNIPTHIHALNVSNTKANVHSPVALNSIAAPVDVNGDAVSGYSTTTPHTALSPNAINPSGGTQPHENIVPYLAVNYIICLEGVFPSRN